MLPVCDVVPRRSHARVTLTTISVLGAAIAWMWTQPPVRPVAWLYLVDAWAIALSAPAVEDRLGPLRFSMLLALCGGAAAAVASGPATWVVLSAVAASTLAGHLTLFPSSQVLAVFVGWPYSVHELPMTSVALVWTAVRVGAWTLQPDHAGALAAVVTPASVAIGAIMGAVLVKALQRRDRASPDWWDAIGRPSGTSH